MTTRALRARRSHRHYLRAVVGRVALVVTCSVGITVLLILPLEKAACEEPAANCMQTWSDAAYWTLTTMTTTGYGDIVPQTATGRAWAVLLMVVGLLLAGLMVNVIALWAIREEQRL